MKLLIGIHGKAKSGKDTLADFLHKNHEFTGTSFAAPIKDAALCVFGGTWEDYNTQEGKARFDEYWTMTHRKQLQDLGETLCDTFGDDFWIKRWFMDCMNLKDTDNIVITDVRKEIEAGFIRRLGGVIVHLYRDGAGLEGEEAKHKTEAGLVQQPGDVVINNNGTLEELETNAAALCAYVEGPSMDEQERLIDPIDIGSHNAEVTRQRAEAAQRAKAAPKQVQNPDGTWPTTECECGEPIGEARLTLGFINCIECARTLEKKEKQYAK